MAEHSQLQLVLIEKTDSKETRKFTSVDALGSYYFDSQRLAQTHLFSPVYNPNSGRNLPVEVAKACPSAVKGNIDGDFHEKLVYDELKRFADSTSASRTVYAFHGLKLNKILRGARKDLFPTAEEDAESYEIDFVVLVENIGVVIIEVKSHGGKKSKAIQQMTRQASAIRSYLGVSDTNVFKLFCSFEDNVVAFKEPGEQQALSLTQLVNKWGGTIDFEKSKLEVMAKTLLVLHHLIASPEKQQRLQGNTLTLNFSSKSYSQHIRDHDRRISAHNVAGTMKTKKTREVPDGFYKAANDCEIDFIGVHFWTKEQADSINQYAGLTVGAAGTGKSCVLKAKVLKILKEDDSSQIIIIASNAMAKQYETFLNKLSKSDDFEEVSCRVEVWNVTKFQQELPEFSNEAFTVVLTNFVNKMDSQSNEPFYNALKQYSEDFVTQLMFGTKQPEDLREQIRGLMSPFFYKSRTSKSDADELRRDCLADELKLELQEAYDFFQKLNVSLNSKFAEKHVFIDDMLALEAENVPQLLAHTIGLHQEDWLFSDLDESAPGQACEQAQAQEECDLTTVPKTLKKAKLQRVFFLDPAQLVLKLTEPTGFRWIVKLFTDKAHSILSGFGLNIDVKGLLSEEFIRSLFYTTFIEYVGFFLGEMLDESAAAEKKRRTCMLRTVMRCGTNILTSWQPQYKDLLSGTCFEHSHIATVTSGHSTDGLYIEKTLTLDDTVAYIVDFVSKPDAIVSDYAVIAQAEERALKKLRDMLRELYGESLVPRAAHETVSLEWRTVFYVDGGNKGQDKYGHRIHEYIAKSRCRTELHHLKIVLQSKMPDQSDVDLD